MKRRRQTTPLWPILQSLSLTYILLPIRRFTELTQFELSYINTMPCLNVIVLSSFGEEGVALGFGYFHLASVYAGQVYWAGLSRSLLFV